MLEHAGVKCKNDLCQFKHIGNIDHGIEENNHDDLDYKFNQLKYMEKFETPDDPLAPGLELH